MKDLMIQAVVLFAIALLVVASKEAKAERDDDLSKLIERLEQEAETVSVPQQEEVIDYELIYEDLDTQEYYNQGETLRIYEEF
jgi:mannose/cellobiose epimerase-like protein (N-acyl-D-glucosamine 2-epimerase family)